MTEAEALAEFRFRLRDMLGLEPLSEDGNLGASIRHFEQMRLNYSDSVNNFGRTPKKSVKTNR